LQDDYKEKTTSNEKEEEEEYPTFELPCDIGCRMETVSKARYFS